MSKDFVIVLVCIQCRLLQWSYCLYKGHVEWDCIWEMGGGWRVEDGEGPTQGIVVTNYSFRSTKILVLRKECNMLFVCIPY